MGVRWRTEADLWRVIYRNAVSGQCTRGGRPGPRLCLGTSVVRAFSGDVERLNAQADFRH